MARSSNFLPSSTSFFNILAVFIAFQIEVLQLIPLQQDFLNLQSLIVLVLNISVTKLMASPSSLSILMMFPSSFNF